MDNTYTVHDMNGDQPFHDLRMENEILKLKLQAEHGASIFSHEDLPPEIEAMFLRQVKQFETSRQNVAQVSIHQLIGSPELKSPLAMDDAELLRCTEILLGKLSCKNIRVEKPLSVDDISFYRFLTEELMQEETDDIQLPGMVRCYDYHMFHPDHAADIRTTAERFIDNWFRKNLEGLKWEMAQGILMPDGSILGTDEIIEMIEMHFEKYHHLSPGKSRILDIGFKWTDETNTGVGHAEGQLYFDIENNNGDVRRLSGSFKIFMGNELGSWSVVYFVMPGFEWGEGQCFW